MLLRDLESKLKWLEKEQLINHVVQLYKMLETIQDGLSSWIREFNWDWWDDFAREKESEIRLKLLEFNKIKWN